MKLREIQADDNQEMAIIIRRSLEEAGLNLPGTAYFDQHLDQLSYFYEREEKSNYWVLVDDYGKIHGGFGVGRFNEDTGELQKLYIAPSALGQGWGRKMMVEAIAYAEKHFTYLYLETFASLSAANHLYQKFGFEQLNQPSPLSEHSACDAWFIKKL